MTAVEKWLRAEVALARARTRADQAMKIALPIEKVVEIQRGRGYQTVQILAHSSGGRRIKVRNLRTHKEYWLASFWFTPEHGGDPT